MELRALGYFVAVAEERHFRRAAERLRIAQPGLSQQIKALERELGAQLIDRKARPIELTEEGRAFLGDARRMIELADRAVARARGAGVEKRVILKFGASAFANGPVVDELVSAARERLPGVDLQLQLDTTAHNLASLDRRALDVAIAYGPFELAEGPRFLRLDTVELVIALPEGHRLAAAERVCRSEILGEPFLTGPKSINPALAEHISRSIFGRADPPNPVEIAEMGTARLQLVARGVGISPVAVPTEPLLPIQGVVYRRMEDPVPTFECGLAWFDDHVSPALPAFIELAREIAEKGAASADGRLVLQDLTSRAVPATART